MRKVFVDTETTGLSPIYDDVLEIAIIDEDGKVLLNTLVQPVKKTEWADAQAINGITPAMVAGCPTLVELAAKIAEAFHGAKVVMYNAAFDYAFLKPCLSYLQEGTDYQVHCAMRRFSVEKGEWDYHKGDYKRWKQIDAAAHVDHVWSGDAHRALTDAQACRSIWQWMPRTESTVKCDCKSRIEEKLLARFKEQSPEATGHEVELKGYGFFLGNSVTIKGVMPIEAKADFPIKKGGIKSKTSKQNMAFSYCPFCGIKYAEVTE